MNKLISLLIVCVIFLPKINFGQEIHSLDLQKAIDLALTENKKILNAKLDVIIAKKKVWETTAMGLPQVSTEAKYQNMLDIPVSLLPGVMIDPNAGPDDYVPVQFGLQHSASFDFTASQLLFSGEYIVALQASKAYQEMSKKAALKSENDVIELVTKSYYALLYSFRSEKIMLETKQDIQKSYDEIQAIHAVGLADQVDVDQLELNLISILSSIRSEKRRQVISSNILKYQIGININDSIKLNDSLEYILDNSKLKSIVLQNFDINKNIEYQILQNKKQITNLSMKLEKSTLLPTLNAFYAHSVTGQTNDFDDYFNDQRYFQSNIVGVSLNWQIWGSGSRYAKIQQAKLEVDKMDNNDFLIEQELTYGVYTARTLVINNYEAYQTEIRNKELAERIYHRSMIKFKNGLITSTALTQLNYQYINAQTAYYNAIVQLLNAKAELDKILGNKINQ